jgi:hypothetical protein
MGSCGSNTKDIHGAQSNKGSSNKKLARQSSKNYPAGEYFYLKHQEAEYI